MSLSTTCSKQHEKEDAIAKRWLSRGLLIATGMHLGLIPLMALVPAEVAQPPERIALVVTGPTDPPEIEEIPFEEIPPGETVEALTEAIAQAELAAATSASGGYSAPPPVSSFQPPTPQPATEPPTDFSEPESFEPVQDPEVPDFEPETSELEPDIEDAATEDTVTEPSDEPVDSEAEESAGPEEDVADAEETESETVEADGTDAEEESNPVETAANNTDSDVPNLEALRDRLRRAQVRQANTGDSTEGSEDTSAATAEDEVETARRDGLSEGSGSGTADGDGDGDRSGSNRVSCRVCDRPDYPEEALAEGIEGSPLVGLEYDENGNVVGTVLQQSSGNAALDRAALEAARGYQMDSGGQSGTVSVQIDFGIEGSERSRAAQRRGERESVSTPAPAAETQREAVQDPAPERAEETAPPADEPAPPAVSEPTPESSEPAPAVNEEVSTPEPEPEPEPEPVSELEPTSETEPADNVPLPEPSVPDIAPSEPAPPASVAPPPESVAPPSEPIAPSTEPISPPSEPVAAPPSPDPAVPDIGPPES